MITLQKQVPGSLIVDAGFITYAWIVNQAQSFPVCVTNMQLYSAMNINNLYSLILITTLSHFVDSFRVHRISIISISFPTLI